MASRPIPIRSYRDLDVWQGAVDLVVEVYRFSAAFPKCETYGVRSQLREAAVSVPANIAEGHGREHLGDYLYQRMLAGLIRALKQRRKT